MITSIPKVFQENITVAGRLIQTSNCKVFVTAAAAFALLAYAIKSSAMPLIGSWYVKQAEAFEKASEMDKSLECFKKAIWWGSADGQYKYAARLYSIAAHPLRPVIYQSLVGRQDLAVQARANLKGAADKGHNEAMALYADWCYCGTGGDKDLPQACAYLKRAADHGNINALIFYADMLYEGDGVPQDHKRARAYFENAAIAGNRYGQAMYARMLQKGEGGNPDLNLARTYRDILVHAADGGEAEAMDALHKAEIDI